MSPRIHRNLILGGIVCLLGTLAGAAEHPLAAPGVTSLTNRAVRYQVAQRDYAVLARGAVTAVIANNRAVDDATLPGHRAGYNGVASLRHQRQTNNLFVPSYAGLNFEHIHDGTLAVKKELFEPRRAPMELRRIDPFTVELYQPPTPNWKLESCGRYHLLADGTIEYTFECIPRANVFQRGFIGLFWASYIHRPEDRAIIFAGKPAAEPSASPRRLRTVSPRHGVESTHPPDGPLTDFNIDAAFPLKLVNHRSRYVYTQPWYYGVRQQLALVLMFRTRDRVWFAQPPTGGGTTNPAWDFQWFIPEYRLGQAYGLVMRAGYLPFTDHAQIEAFVRPHLAALNAPPTAR